MDILSSLIPNVGWNSALSQILLSKPKAEDIIELCINWKVNKGKIEINVWCETQMLLPCCVRTAREHQDQTALKPLCKRSLKIPRSPLRAPALQLLLSSASDSLYATFIGT